MRRGADERQALQQLCLYSTRPALVDDTVQFNAAGQGVFNFITNWPAALH